MLVQFELRGRTGNEEVEIRNREGSVYETIQLSTEWQTFIYHVPQNQPIIIHFLDGNAGDVFLNNPEKYDVIKPNQWENLGCGQVSEDQRCQEIRDGHWEFKGAYEVTLKLLEGMFYIDKLHSAILLH